MTDHRDTLMETEDSPAPSGATSWAGLYGVVLGELAILIILFYAFSQYFQ